MRWSLISPQPLCRMNTSSSTRSCGRVSPGVTTTMHAHARHARTCTPCHTAHTLANGHGRLLVGVLDDGRFAQLDAEAPRNALRELGVRVAAEELDGVGGDHCKLLTAALVLTEVVLC